MKNLKLLLAATLLLGISWFACQDLEFDDYEKTAKVTFTGRIIDEEGLPVSDARVRASGELAMTDANGVFQLKQVNLPAGDARISVSKIGYFDFSRAYIVENGSTQMITIQLLRKELAGTISGSSGGTVQIPGGASLVFPAGSVDYSGQVNVYARYLDPTSPNLPMNMPGDLRGINTGGEEQTLASFGMIGVELKSAGGQELNIAPGSEVEIFMPIPAAKLSVAPAEIALWYYDYDKARWIEEGKAQKIGDQYVGKVRHFSFWNCDAPFPVVQLSGKVYQDSVNTPLVGATVRLTITSSGWQGFAWTDANGCFGGSVPQNEAMKLEIVLPDQCGSTVLYMQDIGPFAADDTLAPIIIDTTIAQAVKVSGILVDCNGQPIQGGYAKINIDGVESAVFANQSGAFTMNVLNCSNGSSGTVIGYDLANLLESGPLTFSLDTNNVVLGPIEICNTLSEYIQFTIDGQSFTKIDPLGQVFPDSLPATGNITLLSAYDTAQVSAIYLSFKNNDQTGNFPFSVLYVNNLEANPANTVTTTVTAFGGVGDPIIGTFGGGFQDTNGASHTISGSYRVIRE
ncbi:MAG: carboxypeptidase regulatory-like domain-containing protein [Lewinellaceae bacterium]|nr:carboxypeptidase regulatory-like domain-containing protein [Lewinellaceae bacterium]